MSDFWLFVCRASALGLNPFPLSRIKQPNTKDLYLDAIAMVFADFDRDCTVFLYPKIPYFTKTTTLFPGRPRRRSRHGPEPVLLDVRSNSERRHSHIEGSLHIP